MNVSTNRIVVDWSDRFGVWLELSSYTPNGPLRGVGVSHVTVTELDVEELTLRLPGATGSGLKNMIKIRRGAVGVVLTACVCSWCWHNWITLVARANNINPSHSDVVLSEGEETGDGEGTLCLREGGGGVGQCEVGVDPVVHDVGCDGAAPIINWW